jgi:hypothetical protein
MVPEVINWEAVRCLSIDGTVLRFIETETQHEIVFPSEDALHEALRRWTIHSGRATEFFQRHDFQSTDIDASPLPPETGWLGR